mmetsp:Transcript_37816/g.60717  ORF Transcript_37816/g.60717 Transcript_37816/m.60717 type:complete len:86 (-) Transcript_37816:110-367(-)
MDADGNGVISRDEFLRSSGVDWDVDHDGKIWVKELDTDGDELLSAREILENRKPDTILDFLASLHFDEETGDYDHGDGAPAHDEL